MKTRATVLTLLKYMASIPQDTNVNSNSRKYTYK